MFSDREKVAKFNDQSSIHQIDLNIIHTDINKMRTHEMVGSHFRLIMATG